jgi:hypothetical protein
MMSLIFDWVWREGDSGEAVVLEGEELRFI